MPPPRWQILVANLTQQLTYQMTYWQKLVGYYLTLKVKYQKTEKNKNIKNTP